MQAIGADHSGVESTYAWIRLTASLALMTISGVGMYGASVLLPAVQREFGAARAEASFPYTLTLIGFGVGGVLMGRLADRFGVMVAVMLGTMCLGLGFAAAGSATSLPWPTGSSPTRGCTARSGSRAASGSWPSSCSCSAWPC